MQSALRYGESHAQLTVAIDGWADAIRPYEIDLFFVKHHPKPKASKLFIPRTCLTQLPITKKVGYTHLLVTNLLKFTLLSASSGDNY
jgi:hypothetical protein